MPRSDTAPPQAAPRRADFVRRRREVIDTFLDLVLAGDPSPDVASIAGGAGVSRASVFRYFETLEELRTEAMGRVLERFADLFEIEAPSSTGTDARVAAFVDSRLRFHARLHPLALLQRHHAVDSGNAAALVDASRNLLADQVRSYFGRELGHLSRARQDDAVVTIAVLTSVESWHQSHHSHGRSQAQIRRAWISAIAAVFAGVGAHPHGEPT
ncbi:MAG: TetR/AcrR family transcriptional regulator [Acidimicrobiales bacterium]